tara:strand:+ start:384 stop:1700 length:1317 start_codon:yes stop_codon:yes gene_type:complete
MRNRIIIYIPKITIRHKYIFNLVFRELYSIDYSLIDCKESYLASNEIKLNYSKHSICDKEIFIQSHGLLTQKGINEIDINIRMLNGQPVFFSAHLESSYPFDLFAASFYLISRYEEYLPHLKDKHNRYKAEESLAFRYGFLEKPIIEIWIKDFIEKLEQYFNHSVIKYPKFKYVSTIDIDNAYLYKGKGFVRSVAFFLKAISEFSYKLLKKGLLVIIGKRKDPYDTYSFQINIQKKYNIAVRYFVLLGNYGVNDKNISHTNSNLKSLVKRLADLAPVGIHPSFGSNFRLGQLNIEINRLVDIQKREVCFSRQHFLQLSFPKTYLELIESGITNDYTMGYASHLGFRAGISSPFTFYNLDMEQILPITIHPFAITDDILNFNMKLSPHEVINKISYIIKDVKQVNGTLITIWHNDSFCDEGNWKGWKNVYEEMIKLIKS